MSVIRAHFDGNVFVPDELVHIPHGTPVQVLVASEPASDRPLEQLAALLEKFPVVNDWPSDGAAEVDHYLYGTPKQAAS